MLPLIVLLLSVFIGSLPSGVLIAKLLGMKDPRSVGSGNIGAANMARSGGLKAGAITFVLDFSKGFLPAFLVTRYGNLPLDFVWIVGAALVVSHCYSAFLRLRGGKGVATAAGVFFALTPLNAAIGLVAWLLIFSFSKITSLAAIGAIFVILVAITASNPSHVALIASIGILIVIVRRHEENLQGLVDGQERRFA